MKYFFSYRAENGYFGRCEFERNKPILSISDIEEIEKILNEIYERKGIDIGKILVTNWQKFEDDRSPGAGVPPSVVAS